jgi:hypothetical protein
MTDAGHSNRLELAQPARSQGTPARTALRLRRLIFGWSIIDSIRNLKLHTTRTLWRHESIQNQQIAIIGAAGQGGRLTAGIYFNNH